MSYEVERIARLCEERKWSRYKLAKEMNESPSNINNLFNRESTPTVHTLKKVCRALGITMSEFYATEGSPASLTADQELLLSCYKALDAHHKEKAVAYLQGLRDGSL